MIYLARNQALLSQEKLDTYNKIINHFIFSCVKILLKMQWIQYWKNKNVPKKKREISNVFHQTQNISTDKKRF